MLDMLLTPLPKAKRLTTITLLTKSLVRGKGVFNWKRSAVRAGALHNDGKALKDIITVDHSKKIGHAPAVPVSDSSLVTPLDAATCDPLDNYPHILIWSLTVGSLMPVEGCGSCRKGTQYRGSNARLGGKWMGWVGNVLARSARWKPICPS